MRNQTLDRVSLPTLFVFCTPNLVIGTCVTALSVVIPAFYAKHTLASLTTIGVVLFSVRLLEAVVDPLAGYLSDITQSRFGPRKPWILAGSLISPFFVYFLFNPSPQATGTYFFVCYAGLVLASWTAIIIPYRAWAVELSRDYDERSRIFIFLGIAYGIGATFFAVFPFLPVLESSEMSPDNIRWIGWALVLAFPISAILTAYFVPTRQAKVTSRSTVKGLLQAIAANVPLQWFLVAYLAGGIGQGIVLACFFFYLDSYLGVGDKFPLALLFVYLTAILSMPIWLRLMTRIGKHRVWAVGWAGAAVLGLCMAFIPKGAEGLIPLLIVVGLYGSCSSVESFAPYAVLGDVIDFDLLKTGVNRSGNFNALAILASKINLAIGGAIGFFLLDIFSFDVSGGTNSASAEFGFLMTFVGLPVVLYAFSSVIVWHFPLDRKKHDIVRRRLAQREEAV